MAEQLASTLGEFEHDNLFAGGVQPVVTEEILLKQGELYLRGTVVSRDSDGKAVIVDSSVPATAKPYGILTDNIDATEEDVPSTVYLTGEFNPNALIFGGTDTVETHKVALREMGIFLKNTQKA